MLDEGESDHKILGVTRKSRLNEVNDLTELDASFPGVREIIEIWFSN